MQKAIDTSLKRKVPSYSVCCLTECSTALRVRPASYRPQATVAAINHIAAMVVTAQVEFPTSSSLPTSTFISAVKSWEVGSPRGLDNPVSRGSESKPAYTRLKVCFCISAIISSYRNHPLSSTLPAFRASAHVAFPSWCNEASSLS